MGAAADNRTVTIATTSGSMPAYDARPPGEPRGGVVVIQEAFGVTSHIEDVTRRFAAADFRALAPHLFYRTGDPALSYDNLEGIWPHLGKLRGDQVLDDIDAVLGYLDDAAGLAPTRVAIVGFCMGGSVTALMAAKRRLGAAVSFYGGGVVEGRFGMPPLLELAQTFQTPWLGLYGGRDEGIPVEQADALREAAKQSPVPTDLVIYPEAAHGFHCNDRVKSYHEASAKDGWRRTLGWLDEQLPAKS